MYGVVENFIGYNTKTKETRRIQIADHNGWYRVIQLAEFELIDNDMIMQTQVLVKRAEIDHYYTLTTLLDVWTILESLGIQKEERLR